MPKKNKNDFVDISNIEEMQKEFMKENPIKPSTKKPRVKREVKKEDKKEIKEPKKLGRPKNIESPETLYQHFLDYCKYTKDNPFKIKDWVGKDAIEIVREKERPLTIEGFENYCFREGIINNLSNYFANSNDAYSDFSTICSRIRYEIRQDQIEGGMSNMYNSSITQRLNNLVEKQEIKQDVTATVKNTIDYSSLSSETLEDILKHSQKTK